MALLGILIAVLAAVIVHHIGYTLSWSPLARIPGPWIFALTKWRLAYEDWKGARTRTIHRLHQNYGPVVRIGPNEVSFNSLAALRQIYGPGSGFGRPRSFYRQFDVAGHPHMFTMFLSSDHAARKKLVSQMYSKSAVLSGQVHDSITRNVEKFLVHVEQQGQTLPDTARSLHYFALDNITDVVFGDGTDALSGNKADGQILNDIEEGTARRYTWFQLHWPTYTRFAMSCGSRMAGVLDVLGVLPGLKPLAYSGLQVFGVKACREGKGAPGSVYARLQNAGVSETDRAAECADHLDAGVQTTTDTLLFTLWALSLPKNRQYQVRLAAEARAASHLSMKECDGLVFLDAVVKEALRLYTPIPASQPRCSLQDATVDGHVIPAGTIVSCQAYSLHRNPVVFPDPYVFNPDRWLDVDVADMKRWWWPFSSGARMCLGMQ